MCGRGKVSLGGSQTISSYNSNNKSLTVTATSLKPNVGGGGNRSMAAKPGPRLTSKEIKERRSTGLCYWCDERYSPNHQCTKRSAFVIHMIDDGSEEVQREHGVEEETEAEAASELQLSLHAMWGLEGAQIMRIKGVCEKKPLRVLIDTGSTHNFLSSQIANKIKCVLVQVSPAAVEVTNGQLLQCIQMCKSLQWEMQGAKFSTRVHIINLDTYDLMSTVAVYTR